MSEIQVNTSDLRNGSQILNDASNKIGDVQSQFSRVLANIGSAYDGQLRQAIEGIVGGSAQTGTRLQNRAIELGNELLSRANAFEVANQATFSSLSNISSQLNGQFPNSDLPGFSWLPKNSDQNKVVGLFGMAGIIGLSGTSLITTIPSKPFSSSNFTLNGLNDSVGLLADKYGMSRSGFKEIGRNLNLLVGNKKAGFVGFMDKTGGFLRKHEKNIGKAVYGISFGLGIAEDRAKGDDWNKALVSESIELGMNISIDLAVKSAAILVPGVGQAYVMYKAGMLIGDATEGALRVAGMNEAADSVDSFFDAYDLDTYTDKFADSIYDSIYDYIANQPSGASDNYAN